MNQLSLLKIAFQVVAFGIFVYQMQNSIRKYTERPIVRLESTVKYEEIKEPIHYLCQEGQFNFSKSKEFGYDHFPDFMKGILENTDHASWNGKNENTTFQKLQEILFDYNYTGLNMQTKNKDITEWEDKKYELFFISPRGFCMNFGGINSGRSRVHSVKETSFFIVDPFLSTSIRLMGPNNEMLQFGTKSNGVYTRFYFHVTISLHDSRINDGLTCTDYEKYGTSYEQCTKDMMKNVMVKHFNCVFPWLQDSSYKTCEKIGINQTISDLLQDIGGYLLYRKTKFLPLCKPPCQTMKFHIRNIDSWKTSVSGRLEFSIDDEVAVHTDTLAYDIFSLVVDLGSALGLWLGLSAVSIFGSIVDYIYLAYSLRCTCCKKENVSLNQAMES